MNAPALYGLVLAGGESRRMGTDKAALTTGTGISWLESAFVMLEPLCAEVFVSCRHEPKRDALRAQFPWIRDDEPGEGPLTGIVSAHRRYPDKRWLILAVDLPKMVPEALARVVRQADKCSTVAQSSRGLEPLCGVYWPDLLSLFAHKYEAGERSIMRVLKGHHDGYRACRLDDVSLTNANRPESQAR